MTVWLWAGAGLLALLAPCALVASRGTAVERLLGLELGSIVTTLALLVLAEGFDRPFYFDLALVFAVLSFGGTVAFIRFLERWV